MSDQKLEALLIFPYAGIRPVCADFENCTVEEQISIDEWQAITDNNNGLKAKINKVENWLLDGIYIDISNPKKGQLVIKAGILGIANSFPMKRILKPNPTQWFINKVAVLRATGWQLRGWATDNWYQELINRGYEKLVVEE